MSIKSVIISFFVIALMSGCFSAKKIQPNLQSQVASNGIVNTANNIQSENQTIKTTAQDISKSTHEPSTAAKAGVIITSTGRIDNAFRSIIASSQEINKISIQSEKEKAELKSKIDKLEKEKKSVINKIFTMFYVISILSIFGSIGLFFAGKVKIGATIGGAAVVILVLTHILQTYWTWFVFAGIGLLAIIIGWSLYDLIKNHRNLLKELAEEIKEELAEDNIPPSISSSSSSADSSESTNK